MSSPQPAALRAQVPFSMVPKWVTFHAELSPHAVRLYAGLAAHTNGDTGTAWPSKETLAGELHMSERTVVTATAELVAAGALAVRARWRDADGALHYERGPGRRQTTNEYVVMVTPPEVAQTPGVQDMHPQGGVQQVHPSGVQDMHPNEKEPLEQEHPSGAPASASAAPPPPSAPTDGTAAVVAHYVELHVQRPPARLIGRLARSAKELHAEGFTTEQLVAAVDRMVGKGLDVALLPSLVNEVANAAHRPNRSNRSTIPDHAVTTGTMTPEERARWRDEQDRLALRGRHRPWQPPEGAVWSDELDGWAIDGELVHK